MSRGADEPDTWVDFKRTNYSSNLTDSDLALVRCNTPQAIIAIKSSSLPAELTSHVCSPVPDLWLSPGRLSWLPTPTEFLSDSANISYYSTPLVFALLSCTPWMNYNNYKSCQLTCLRHAHYRRLLVTSRYSRWSDVNESFCLDQDPDFTWYLPENIFPNFSGRGQMLPCNRLLCLCVFQTLCERTAFSQAWMYILLPHIKGWHLKRPQTKTATTKTATNENSHRLKWPQSDTKMATFYQQAKSHMVIKLLQLQHKSSPAECQIQYTYRSVPEIFGIKVESYQKSRRLWRWMVSLKLVPKTLMPAFCSINSSRQTFRSFFRSFFVHLILNF